MYSVCMYIADMLLHIKCYIMITSLPHNHMLTIVMCCRGVSVQSYQAIASINADLAENLISDMPSAAASIGKSIGHNWHDQSVSGTTSRSHVHSKRCLGEYADSLLELHEKGFDDNIISGRYGHFHFYLYIFI